MPWNPKPAAAKPLRRDWRDDCHLMAGVRATTEGGDVYLDLNGERPLIEIDTDNGCAGLDLLDLIAYLKAHRPDLLQESPIHLDLPVT